jgi:hypothetical protein
MQFCLFFAVADQECLWTKCVTGDFRIH